MTDMHTLKLEKSLSRLQFRLKYNIILHHNISAQCVEEHSEGGREGGRDGGWGWIEALCVYACVPACVRWCVRARVCAYAG